MSDFKVPYTRILNVSKHPNADRLDVVTVYGFQVVTQSNKYQVGDTVVYVPIDSILPQWLEDKLFPADSKIKLSNHRVRQIRIRQLASQGMIIDPSVFSQTWSPDELEKDFSQLFGITKYEPPVRGVSQVQGKRDRNRKADNPMFHKYNGLDSIKWFPDLFKEGEMVVIQEKLHGTNARAGIVPFAADTLWKKLQVRLGIAPKWEEHYGSNNVQISGKIQGIAARIFQFLGIRKGTYVGYYGEDLYGAAFAKCKAFEKILPGEIIYGEVIGPGIQKGYDYGLTEQKFVLFDVKRMREDGSGYDWLNPHDVVRYAEERGFEMVPMLLSGPYNKEEAYSLTSGSSAYHPGTPVREGIVIKAAEGYSIDGNKRALKWISEVYLDDKSNTDFH